MFLVKQTLPALTDCLAVGLPSGSFPIWAVVVDTATSLVLFVSSRNLVDGEGCPVGLAIDPFFH